MMMIKSYSLKLGTLMVLMCAILFTACDEQTVRDYRLSDEIKSISDFADGSTWTYDVKVNQKIPLRHEFEIVDTLRDGDTIKAPTDRVFTIDKRPGELVFNFEHTFIDSVFLFGHYRVVTFDTTIVDTISTTRKFTIYGSDSLIFRAKYTVYDTLFYPEYTDVVTAVSRETEIFTYEMGNDKVSEERMKNSFISSLNKNERLHDVKFASSNGTESYRRDIQPYYGYYTSYELKYVDNTLDKTAYPDSLGTYSYELENSKLVNGISYDNVQVIKSKYEITDYFGETVKRDIEYWVVPGTGVIKIEEQETASTWLLKSSNIK